MGIGETKARFYATPEGSAHFERVQLYASALTDTTRTFSPSNFIDFYSQGLACIYEAKRLEIAIQALKRREPSSNLIRIASYDAPDPTTVYLTPEQNVIFTNTSSGKKFEDNRSMLYTGVWVDLQTRSSHKVTVRVKDLTTATHKLANDLEKKILILFQGQNFVPDLKETAEYEIQEGATLSHRYVSIESVHGETLSDIRYDPSSPKIPFLFFQILKIVKIFHNQGLVIREIKPENFYLTGNPLEEVVISNLNCVYKSDAPEQSVESAYTIGYLSPESAKGVSSGGNTSNVPLLISGQPAQHLQNYCLIKKSSNFYGLNTK